MPPADPASAPEKVAAPGGAMISSNPSSQGMVFSGTSDVGSKIMSTFQNGSCSFHILSATGAMSTVTLQQAATSGPVTYEGPFEILSLSGSYVLSECAGRQTWNGALSVSLAGIDGWVLGGRVAGLCKAATPVKVIAGSFIAGVEEPKQSDPLVLPSTP